MNENGSSHNGNHVCPPAQDTDTHEEDIQSVKTPPTADVGRRITAAFLDGCVALILYFALGWLGTFSFFFFIHSTLLHWIGPILYILIRDMYKDGRPISFGKKLARLDIFIIDTQRHPDFVGSIQRNILFFFPPLSLCLAGLELYLIIRSPDQRRFGDFFGKTIVTQRDENKPW